MRLYEGSDEMEERTQMVVAGVDTHLAEHVLCLLDGNGRPLMSASFPADEAGYAGLAAAIGDPAGCLAVGVEGTASYGAGLARHLLAAGYPVAEVLRPKRARRRAGRDKNDFADAERAARDALAGTGVSTPKSQDGWVEALRFLQVARDAAVQAQTAAMNRVKGLLATAPEPIRAKYLGMGDKAMMKALRRRRAGKGGSAVDAAAFLSLRSLSSSWDGARRQAASLGAEMAAILAEEAPALLAIYGCGTVTAAALAVAAGDNPSRLGSKGAFASLCAACPVDASSGQVVRRRLNRGGNRAANRALHQIVVVRLRHDGRTQAYAARRRAEGKTDREIVRCLVRYVANEVYRALLDPKAAPERPGPELRGLRLSLGVSQAAAGAALGVPSSRISDVERGVRRLPGLEDSYRAWLVEEEMRRA